MNIQELKKQVNKASNIIESIDESVTNHIVTCKYASDDFKKTQRVSNAILNVTRALDVLKYEL